MDQQSHLIAFYTDADSDNKGRTRKEILTWDQHKLEYTHDYIQWLFPLNAPSAFNPNAPLLTTDDIQAFKQSEKLQHNMIECLQVMLDFYGLEIQNNQIQKNAHFEDRAANWLHPGNHNLLRITRILKSLCLAGLNNHAVGFYNTLAEINTVQPDKIGDSFNYWQQTIQPCIE